VNDSSRYTVTVWVPESSRLTTTAR
jgi:hypothetical protein